MLHKISKQQQLLLLQTIGTCHDINSFKSFSHFIQNDLQSLLPHDHAVIGVNWKNDMTSRNNMMVNKVINVNFVQDYLDQIISPDGRVESPTVRAWMKSGKPQCDKRDPLQDYGIYNVAGHGIIDTNGAAMAFFGFGNMERGNDPRHKYFMELLIPHLYVATKYFLNNPVRTEIQPITLTKREAETLKWIACGKTNWEIGRILNISEKTVRNHTVSAMKKLNVHTRAHAIAKAIYSDLITL